MMGSISVTRGDPTLTRIISLTANSCNKRPSPMFRISLGTRILEVWKELESNKNRVRKAKKTKNGCWDPFPISLYTCCLVRFRALLEVAERGCSRPLSKAFLLRVSLPQRTMRSLAQAQSPAPWATLFARTTSACIRERRSTSTQRVRS